MAWANWRCVMPSFSNRVRMTVNWSGVKPRCAMRRRNVWFKPYHARRNNRGKRRRSGESMAAKDLKVSIYCLLNHPGHGSISHCTSSRAERCTSSECNHLERLRKEFESSPMRVSGVSAFVLRQKPRTKLGILHISIISRNNTCK